MVVGQASDPYRARDLLVELEPDVITLDVEMPRMDGVTFLKRFMPVMPTPTVVISSLTQAGKRICLEALEAGAVDVVAKPVLGLVDGLPLMLDDICRRVKAAADADVSRFGRRSSASSLEPVPSSLDETTDRVIALGASTGGVEALARIAIVLLACLRQFYVLLVQGVIRQNIGNIMEEGAKLHAEAYRVLRTNILFSRKNESWNTISALSSGAGEGKTTTLFNLAASLPKTASGCWWWIPTSAVPPFTRCCTFPTRLV